MLRDSILITQVYPSANVHLIPGSTLLFDVYISDSLTPRDVKTGVCVFGNEYNTAWIESTIIYINEKHL